MSAEERKIISVEERKGYITGYSAVVVFSLSGILYYFTNNSVLCIGRPLLGGKNVYSRCIY